MWKKTMAFALQRAGTPVTGFHPALYPAASQICETVLQQAYAFGNRPGARFYDLLHYGKHLGNDDLTAVALVRV